MPAFGLSTTVADARFAKPLDEDLIRRLARNHEVLVTVEEGSVGGFGSHVLQFLADSGLLDRGLKVRTMVLPDIVHRARQAGAMYEQAGLTACGHRHHRARRPRPRDARRRSQPRLEPLAAHTFSEPALAAA